MSQDATEPPRRLVRKRRPRPGDLVYESRDGDALRFVKWRGEDFNHIVQVQKRGSTKWDDIEFVDEDKFMKRHEWNSARGLAGGWEPKQASEA